MSTELDPRLRDWRWRINNLYTIVNKDGRRVRFIENGIQKQINDCKKRRKMVLKYRQAGVTTNEIKKQLDFVAFGMNKNACIMADKDENMEKIFSKARDLYNNMHPKFKPRLDRGGGSKYELRFPDINGRIYCALQGRGDTIHWLHISEAAFAQPDRIKATLEAVPINTGVVTWETTANGMGNHYYRRWITPSSNTAKLFFPWFMDPANRIDGRNIKQLTQEEFEFKCRVFKKYNGMVIDNDQIAFRRAKQEDQQELFLQEYPEDDISCFLATGGAVLDLQLIKRLIDNSPEPIADDGQMKIFKEYDSSRLYACGADTAEGVGKDYSVGTMFDVQTREEVAQIRSNKWKPREFAIQLNALCNMYQKSGRIPPLLGVERNNHGHAVLLELEEHIGYPNLYKYKSTANGDPEDVAGWKTDLVTRPLMLDAFVDGVDNSTIRLNSRDTLGECLTLIDNNGKIEAEDGENDDCIISCAIGIQMCIVASRDLHLYDDLQESILL